MATCMADAWECIVLCVEIDSSVAIPTNRLKRRLQSVSMSLDLVAEFLQKVTDGIMGLVLLVRQLRVVVDLCSQ